MGSLAAFAIAMAVLAASPGPGLAAVLSRALSVGPGAGLRVVLGMIVVDFLFLGVAAAGLSAIAAAFGPWFQAIKYLAACYLIYVGIQTLRHARRQATQPAVAPSSSTFGDVSLGGLVTLGNPKAILFYSALLPAFFDIAALGTGDYLSICSVIVAVSLAVYGTYIAMATKVFKAANTMVLRRIQIGSGLTLLGSGTFLALRD